MFAGTVAAQSGYPYTQVPFTSVKITPNTFWGDRIQAAREVTIPLAFSKCESEHRYKNFEMAAYTLQHPDMNITSLLESDEFSYAASGAVSDETDANFAEFTI